MIAVQVNEASQVAEARREACRHAALLGFDEADTGRVAIVATELATNLVRHGGGGEVLIAAYDDALGVRLDVTALDKGPGIADVAACLRDGHSTAGSAGIGLGAIDRLSAAFHIHTRIGGGTVAMARLHPRRRPPAPADVVVAGVCLPKAGETDCGDCWAFRRDGATCSVLLADGLGHGPLAAAASTAAAETFARQSASDPAQAIHAMHAALRVTRGAAVSLVRLDFAAATATFCGIGNVGGVVLRGGMVQRMVSLNGTAGAAARHVQSFDYQMGHGAVVVLFSDGLTSSWSTDPYPGLLGSDPAVIAAVLYRDFARGRDDVTVVVVKEAG